MPKISIIIPIYNVEKYLNRCLDSVIGQSFSDFEAICINDGSTDTSLQILQDYAFKDARIKIITQENQGQSVARNKGLDIAIGDYIYFVDSDDFIHKQSLEILLNVIERSNSPMVAAPNIHRFNRNKNKFQEVINLPFKYKIYNNPIKDIFRTMWTSSVIWSKLYKKELFNDRRFLENNSFEDWPFIATLCADINNYACVDYVLYHYNDYNTSVVRSTFTIRKLHNYEEGIVFVHQYFQKPENKKHWRFVQKKRIAASVKMMVNKVRKEPVNQLELKKELVKTISKLREEKIIKLRDLPIKTILRFFKITQEVKK